MKYDVSIIMRSYTGAPFVQPNPGPDGEILHLTLKDMLESSLVNADPQEFNTGEKKLEIYRLLQKIHSAKTEVNLTVEELATIKKIVAKNMTVSAYGAINDVLESPKESLLAPVGNE